MDPLQANQAIEQFRKLLEQEGRLGQADDFSLMMWYLSGMTRQYEAVIHELHEVRQQLHQIQEPSAKYVVQNAAAKLEHKANQLKESLDNLWARIAGCVASAVENFKEAGVTALDQAVAAMGVKDALASLQEKISGMIADTKKNIEKLEDVGHELRSVGGHLKNAGRAMAGKETQAVDGGQEGRFQSVVLAPMRATQKLLTNMNNATLITIGTVERLEQRSAEARDRQAERAAQKPGKRLEKKSSIREAIKENQAELAASTVAASRDKTQEAAL